LDQSGRGGVTEKKVGEACPVLRISEGGCAKRMGLGTSLFKEKPNGSFTGRRSHILSPKTLIRFDRLVDIGFDQQRVISGFRPQRVIQRRGKKKPGGSSRGRQSGSCRLVSQRRGVANPTGRSIKKTENWGSGERVRFVFAVILRNAVKLVRLKILGEKHWEMEGWQGWGT